MDFTYSEEQELLRQTVRDFAEKELSKDAQQRDAEEKFPKEHVKKMGELGFMGLQVDPSWGGGGMDTVAYSILIEELSRVDASLGVIASVNNSLVCYGLEKYGTDAQKEKYLKPLAQGMKLGAYCLSEPGTGSDASALQSTCSKDGDDWIINGTKISSPMVPRRMCILYLQRRTRVPGMAVFVASSLSGTPRDLSSAARRKNWVSAVPTPAH